MAVPVERRSDGTVWLSIGEAEAEFLERVAGQLEEVLANPEGTRDEVLGRLFPRAYLDPTEEEAEREWQAFVHPGLLAQKRAGLEVLTTGLRDATRRRGRVEVCLDDEAVEGWLGALNDLRLALGARLGVTEDLDVDDLDDLDPDDPATGTYALYSLLTYYEAALVDILLG